jgi:predicted metal-binding membrane protein
MNLVWIAGIALFVAVEKFSAGRRWLTIGTGGVLTASGLYVLAAPYLVP